MIQSLSTAASTVSQQDGFAGLPLVEVYASSMDDEEFRGAAANAPLGKDMDIQDKDVEERTSPSMAPVQPTGTERRVQVETHAALKTLTRSITLSKR